jgi:hypothetical protein
MQKWQYGYLYEVQVIRPEGQPRPWHFIVAEARGTRLLDQTSRLAALDALGAGGWIISQNERPNSVSLQHGHWIVEFMQKLIPHFGHINFNGQYFMRRSADSLCMFQHRWSNTKTALCCLVPRGCLVPRAAPAADVPSGYFVYRMTSLAPLCIEAVRTFPGKPDSIMVTF